MHTSFPAYPDIVRAIAEGSPDRLLPGAVDPALFARHPAALDAVESAARASLGTPPPDLPFSKFRLFRDTGDRAAFEKPYFERRIRLSQLVVAILGGRDADGALLTALEDAMWEMCNEYTWALPAHLWGAGPREERKRDERHTLDLFASETGHFLAETLHVLGDRLDPRVVVRVRAEIRDRILDSFLGPYETPPWAGGYNNWAAVCAGSIGAAFLYEERDPARLRHAMVHLIGIMEAFIDSFPEDGACEEGAGYWDYGFGYFTLFADLLREYTGGALDLFQAPGVRRIAAFPQAIRLTPTRAASFSDGGRFWTPGGWLHSLLHARFPDIPATSGVLDPKVRFSRAGQLLRDFLLCDPSMTTEPLPDDVAYLPDAQWLVVRRAPFAFAALFGNNGVSHNHNDVGSFLLVDGDREGPMDLGSGLYTRQYFSDERYGDAILCCGSQGHSLPVVGGARQQAGAEFRAAGVRFERAFGDAEVDAAKRCPPLDERGPVETHMLSSGFQAKAGGVNPPGEPQPSVDLKRLAETARPTPLVPKEVRNPNVDSANHLSEFGGDNVLPQPAEIVFSGDIACAYGLPALRSLRRTFRIRPAEGAVRVEDAFDHEGGLPPSVERFIGFEKPVIEGPGRARFGAFAVRFDPALAAEVRPLPYPTRGPTVSTAYALDIALPAGTDSFAIDFARP